MADITVSVKQGILQGVKVDSPATGQPFFCFKGIPYAKPPVGPLRFKPPQPPEPWEGVRSAVKDGDCCPQFFRPTSQYAGDEDCLFLNVYSKQWPPTSPKPVMVMIHGGGFIMGSGNTERHGPDFLVAEDVIVVSLNYRLGVLGFLHVEGSDVSPNNGLRDQNAALKWVKENISNFGGDPNNVTLFGCSAGGASVHYQMFAPSSRGLFHRAIAQSGCAFYEICNIPHNVAMERAVRLGKALGADTTDPQKLADFLRTVPAKDLILADEKSLSDEEKLHTLTISFVPSEESRSNDAFIPGHPETLVWQERFHKVPLITGITSAEGKLCLHSIFPSPTINDVNENFERALNCNLRWRLGEEKFKDFSQKIKDFYFGEESISEENAAKYVQLQSDLCFAYPFYKTVKYQLECSKKTPTYIYQFSMKGPASDAPGVSPLAGKLPGADHGTDNMFLYYSPLKPVKREKGSPEEMTTKNIVKLFTNFAKTGDPTDGMEVTWPPVRVTEKMPFMDISDKLAVKEDLNEDRMKFIDQFFKDQLYTD